MNRLPTFVLLHGAGLGPPVWSRVIEHLPAPAIALKLNSRHRGVSPASCAAAIAAETNRLGLHDIVFIFHSLAGVLAAALEAALTDRIRGSVFIAAIVPRRGESFARSLGFPATWILPTLFALNPNGLRPTDSMIRRELCNDLSLADTNWVLSHYAGEYPGLFLTAIESTPTSPTGYIKLLNDKTVAPRLQDRIIAQIAPQEVIAIDAGHLAMLSAPREVARAILKMAME